MFIENRYSYSIFTFLFKPDNLVELLKNMGRCVMVRFISLEIFFNFKKEKQMIKVGTCFRVQWKITPRKITHPDNAPGQLPLRKSAPWTIAPDENYPPGNCPLTIKFSPKMIAPLKQILLKEYYEWTEGNYALSKSTIIK